MKRRLPKRSIACFVLATALIALGVYIVRGCWERRVAFEHERDTPLGEFDCDLSKPGEHDFDVSVRYPSGHWLRLELAMTPSTTNKDELTDRLAMLNAGVEMRFTPDEHSFSDSEPFDCTRERIDWTILEMRDGSVVLDRLNGTPPGKYHLHLTVRKGAPGLASVPHRLVVMNDVCGCELLMDSILCMFVAGLGLVSLLLIGAGIAFKWAANEPAVAPPTR